MATQTSSLIGANLSGASSDATALFALGTTADGTSGSRWEYIEVTATCITGEFVLISPAGTGTRLRVASLTANASGYDIGACQGGLNQGEFAWVAKQGRNLYILCTGTITAGNDTGVGFVNTGRLAVEPSAAVGSTAWGIFLTSSTPTTGGANATLGTITFPRVATKDV